MDNLVISKIGEYLVIRDIWQVSITSYYWNNIQHSETERKFFSKYINMYSWIQAYIEKIETTIEPAFQIIINGMKYLKYDDNYDKLTGSDGIESDDSEPNEPSNFTDVIFTHLDQISNFYAKISTNFYTNIETKGHVYNTKIEITKIQLSD
jgi:hypothetical protein